MPTKYTTKPKRAIIHDAYYSLELRIKHQNHPTAPKPQYNPKHYIKISEADIQAQAEQAMATMKANADRWHSENIIGNMKPQ